MQTAETEGAQPAPWPSRGFAAAATGFVLVVVAVCAALLPAIGDGLTDRGGPPDGSLALGNVSVIPPNGWTVQAEFDGETAVMHEDDVQASLALVVDSPVDLQSQLQDEIAGSRVASGTVGPVAEVQTRQGRPAVAAMVSGAERSALFAVVQGLADERAVVVVTGSTADAAVVEQEGQQIVPTVRFWSQP